MSVVGGASAACFNPIVIYPCQLIPKQLLLRPHEAQPLIEDFKVTMWRNCDYFTWWDRFVVEAEFLNHDRRRLLIKVYTGRINHRRSVSRGEPEPAVSRLPTRRPAAAVALQSEQAIPFSVSDRSNPASLSMGK